jgi:hypothetical protein
MGTSGDAHPVPYPAPSSIIPVAMLKRSSSVTLASGPLSQAIMLIDENLSVITSSSASHAGMSGASHQESEVGDA